MNFVIFWCCTYVWTGCDYILGMKFDAESACSGMSQFKDTLIFHGTATATAGSVYSQHFTETLGIYILVTNRHTIPSIVLKYANHCMVTLLDVYCGVWHTCTVRYIHVAGSVIMDCYHELCGASTKHASYVYSWLSNCITIFFFILTQHSKRMLPDYGTII